MIPHVEHGDRIHGLLIYLAGPGRANEHEDPHLVAGDDAMMAWYGDEELDKTSAHDVARHLDRPRKAFDKEPSGGHVWHCSLAINAEEGLLDEDKWRDIARDFVAGMGFDDQEGTRAPCRWVAVRHGLSKGGNDHIHIVVNRVREDGLVATMHQDLPRSQKVARALEVKHGLRRLDTSRSSRRGYSPGEQRRVEERAEHVAQQKYERGEANGSWADVSARDRQRMILAEVRVQAPRNRLARTVRASATASTSEAEFVRRMRAANVIVRPRFARGTQDVVTGFSVAEKPEERGGKPLWFGGGMLGRDLSISRLRQGWPDTPHGATEAAAEWNAARRGKRVVSLGRETTEPSAEQVTEMNGRLVEIRDDLSRLDPLDRRGWESTSRQLSGVFAAWSNSLEATPGPLAEASDSLAAVARAHRYPIEPKPSGRVAMSSAAMVAATVARGGQGSAAQVALLRQVLNLSGAVHDAVKAQGDAQRAEGIVRAVRERAGLIRHDIEAARTSSPSLTEVSSRVGTESTVDEAVQNALHKMSAAESRRESEPAKLVPEPLRGNPVEQSRTTPSRSETGVER